MNNVFSNIGAISYSWYVQYKDKDRNFSNTKTELDWISEL